MDFLGSVGLTLALAVVAQKLLLNILAKGLPQRAASLASTLLVRLGLRSPIGARWSPSLDFRYVLFGGFAPDVLDKALAFWIAPELVNSSPRNFGHTLLGGMAIVLAVWFATRRGGAVAGCLLAVVGHLILDRMYSMPGVLFWPLQGREFPPGDVPLSHWLNVHFLSLPQSPLDWTGIALLVAFAAWIIVSGRTGQFVRHGRIP